MFFKINSQRAISLIPKRSDGDRGEIATTLTLIAVVVMAAGAIIGANLTNQKQDISSKAQTTGVLACDPGPNPYSSNQITITNNSGERVEMDSNVFRCKYEPNRVRIGYYKCEDNCDGDGPDCQEGVWDPAASENYFLNPGEKKVVTVTANPCEIVQLDAYNKAVHVDDSVAECTNIGSQYTEPIGKRWPGGIGFAIWQNSNCTGTTTQPTQSTQPGQCSTQVLTECSRNCSSSCSCQNGSAVCPAPTPTLGQFEGANECRNQYKGACMTSQACTTLARQGTHQALSLPRGCTAPENVCCAPILTPTPTAIPTATQQCIQSPINGFCVTSDSQCTTFSGRKIASSSFGCPVKCCIPSGTTSFPTWTPTPTPFLVSSINSDVKIQTLQCDKNAQIIWKNVDTNGKIVSFIFNIPDGQYAGNHFIKVPMGSVGFKQFSFFDVNCTIN